MFMKYQKASLDPVYQISIDQQRSSTGRPQRVAPTADKLIFIVRACLLVGWGGESVM
jgi:hypothetical protein